MQSVYDIAVEDHGVLSLPVQVLDRLYDIAATSDDGRVTAGGVAAALGFNVDQRELLRALLYLSSARCDALFLSISYRHCGVVNDLNPQQSRKMLANGNVGGVIRSRSFLTFRPTWRLLQWRINSAIHPLRPAENPDRAQVAALGSK